MDDLHNGPDKQDPIHECKFCGQKFETLQLVLKHELINHTEDKTPRAPAANKLKRKVNVLVKTMNNEDAKQTREELIEAISNCQEGYELHTIFNKYHIRNEDLVCICQRVHKCLTEEINKHGELSIEVFGSITTGLALKTSDIDLHVSNRVRPVESYVLFREITKMLFRSRCFTEICPIRSATVPIIKCVHKATGFHLDINTSEPFGVYNSRFIRQLIASDSRIHQLVLFLKIWCRNTLLNGQFNMTNYCLITLVIFYLQNSNPPVLDSIKILQRNAPKRFVNGVNFEVNTRYIPVDTSQSIHDLIRGFFQFYDSFKFEDFIIAPYLGKSIKRDEFNSQKFMYLEYEMQLRVLSKNGEVERLRTDKPVCIQDCFCLNRNVGKCLNASDLQYFRECLSLAHNKCSEPSISQKDLYKYLLFSLIDDIIDTSPPSSLPAQQKHLTFDIIPRKSELKCLCKFESDPLLAQKLWAKEYTDAVIQIVTDIFRVEMTKLSPTESVKSKKFDETDESAPVLPSEWSINCSVDLWSGRQVQRNNTTSFMDYHLEQTKKMHAERRQHSNFAVQIKGQLTISVVNNYDALRVEVNTTDARTNINKLRRFFNALKSIMQNYNLKQRIHELEAETTKK